MNRGLLVARQHQPDAGGPQRSHTSRFSSPEWQMHRRLPFPARRPADRNLLTLAVSSTVILASGPFIEGLPRQSRVLQGTARDGASCQASTQVQDHQGNSPAVYQPVSTWLRWPRGECPIHEAQVHVFDAKAAGFE